MCAKTRRKISLVGQCVLSAAFAFIPSVAVAQIWVIPLLTQ